MNTDDYLGSKVHNFIAAAANSQIKTMRQLLDEGVDINATDPIGRTALSAAASLGLIKSVTFLIDNGANLNPIDSDNMTPLMGACSTGKIKGSSVALCLIKAKADVHYIRVSDQMTALKFASKSCTPEVIQALIDHGAEVDGPRGTEQTALMLAARENHVEAIKVLVANGADTSLPCKLGWANNMTAQELAESQGCREAATYLASLVN